MKGSGIIAVIAVCVCLIGPAGLSSQEMSWEKPVKVGVALPEVSSSWWSRADTGFRQSANSFDCSVVVLIADNDPGRQLSQVNQLIHSGIKVLVIGAVMSEDTRLADLIAEAKSAGIFVISFDRLIKNTADIDMYVTYDPVETGRLMGKWLIHEVPTGNYWLFKGPDYDPYSEKFFRGAMEILQIDIDSGRIRIASGPKSIDNWDPSEAKKITAVCLESKSLPDAILAPNDETAGGIIRAFRDASRPMVPITGQDAELAAIQRIAAGEQGMTVLKDGKQLANSVLFIIQQIGNGKSIDSLKAGYVNNGGGDIPSFYPPPQIVTKENLNELIIKEKIYNSDQILGH